MAVGLRIKELRKSRGISQADFAAALGMEQQAVSNIETGKTQLKGLELAVKIAQVLGVSVADIAADAQPEQVQS